MKKTIGITAFLTVLTLGISSCQKSSAPDFSRENFDNIYLQEEGLVDMGTGDVLWAACNLGATAPEQEGDFYSWGEVAKKESYTNKNHKYLVFNSDTDWYYTKYNDDNLTVLEKVDDAATVVHGDGWRIPTYEEFKSLLDNCTWRWGTYRDVVGRLATSKITGSSLFFPAAGLVEGAHIYSTYFSDQPYGNYLTSELREEIVDPEKGQEKKYAYVNVLHFTFDCCGFNYSARYYGLSVRPVKSF